MAPTLEPRAVKERLRDGAEIALLDPREEGEFAEGHLLFASNLPLSRLELRAGALVPRKSTPIVVCDGGGGLAERAAAALAGLGYAEVTVLAGGTPAWRRAGYVLFSGVNVPSKAFGEFVEHHYRTPSISAAELKAMMDQGERLVILDSRPIEEFRNMSIPGAIDVPGGELVYRVGDLAPDPATTVVVNCAGRTRSIIGAQSLINAGIPNRVVALRNGTMGWHLAGLALDRGQDRRYPEGRPASLAAARAAAGRVAERFGVGRIDLATLARWQDEAERRTLYLVDVRDPAEYRRAHLRGSRPAPGGQLVQTTDQVIGVRGARVVLVDDTGVRATMTAHWLKQMGIAEVYVLDGGLDDETLLEAGEWVAPAPEPPGPPAPEIAPGALRAALGRGEAAVLDLGFSRAYRRGHIAGASWAVRGRIAATAGRLPQTGALVLASCDGRLARFAVPEVRALTRAEITVLAGGTRAWQAAGLPLEANRTVPPDEACVDVFLRAYDRNSRIEEKMNEYLSWEVDLVEQIAADGDARFGAPAA